MLKCPLLFVQSKPTHLCWHPTFSRLDAVQFWALWRWLTGGWDWAFRARPHSRDPRQQNPAPRLGVIRWVKWRWRWDPAWRIGLGMRYIMAIWLVETVETVGFRHVFVSATMESKTWMLPDVFLQCRIPLDPAVSMTAGCLTEPWKMLKA